MTTGSRPAPSRVAVFFQGKAGFILLDQLRTPVRAALAGEASDGLVIDGVNRRGRPVLVRVRFAPLASTNASGQ